MSEPIRLLMCSRCNRRAVRCICDAQTTWQGWEGLSRRAEMVEVIPVPEAKRRLQAALALFLAEIDAGRSTDELAALLSISFDDESAIDFIFAERYAELRKRMQGPRRPHFHGRPRPVAA